MGVEEKKHCINYAVVLLMNTYRNVNSYKKVQSEN